MDAIPFINEMLHLDALKIFLKNTCSEYLDYLDSVIEALLKVEMFMKRGKFMEQDEDKRQALIEGFRLTVRKVGDFMSHIVQQSSQSHSSNHQNNLLVEEWKETLDFILGVVYFGDSLMQAEANDQLGDVHVNAVINFPDDIESIQNIIFDGEKSRALLLKKAFPDLRDAQDPTVQNFEEICKQLDNLPQLISSTCNGQPLALVLVGSLLSLKEKAYDIWYRVKEDLSRINNHPQGPTLETYNHEERLSNIIQYCYDDLPYFLKPCFHYLACYPNEFEIPARSLTEIWIAEGFIVAEEGMEEIA